MHLGLEGQLANDFLLMVVPKHDFVWRELGVITTADKSKDIAAEEHLDDANATLQI